MERLFLDGNVLFSAAYRKNAGVLGLWKLSGVVLLTSSYEADQARRNLPRKKQVARLERLLRDVEITEGSLVPSKLRRGIDLPERCWLTLGAAAACNATHLITGDMRDFGQYFHETLLEVEVVPPASYLARST